MKKVLLIQPIHLDAIKRLQEEVQVVIAEKTDEDYVKAAIVDADGVTNSYWYVTNATGHLTSAFIKNIERDPFVFYAISVPTISISGGSIDIYVKSLR